MSQKPLIGHVATLIVTVVTPFVILMLSIRLLIMPSFARFSYQLPNFPDDPYGFSNEERLRWSEPSIIYLVNQADISYLSDLTFDDGEAVFNARELSHMEDVKEVVTGMRVAMVVLVVLLLIISLVMIRRNNKNMLIKAFNHGGWATIGLIVAILIFVALNFDSLFTWFHQIFFESGTWQFHPSDTLIRLFPVRFWRDAFIFVGLQSLLYGGFLIFVTRKHS